MKVILKEDVPNLGSIGDIVTVKSKGYVRNFLLPKDLVLIANNTNQKMIERDLKKLEKKKQEQIAAAKTLAKTIDKISVTVTKQVGENEKIFGSVTTAELEELLKTEGVEISKKDIALTEDIKKIGVYTAEVRVHPEVKAKFKVWVVAQ